MALLKGIFALLLALVAAVSFVQDPQGAYSASGCTSDQPYPQVTKDMPGTKFDCTLTIYNANPNESVCDDDPESWNGCPEDTKCTDMYLFLRASKGNDTWAFATKVEKNCYGSFVPEQAKIEKFLRNTVLPGIYDPGETGTPTFCSVWLEEQTGDLYESCNSADIPFAMKSVTQVAEDAVDTNPPNYHPAWTDYMFVSIFNVTVAVQD